MAGQLPGVRELRLHPEEWAELGNGGGQAELSPVGAGEVSADTDESTVSFKDLATLVAVVLDRKDAMDRAGSRERNQAAATSAWPTDVARSLPPFTPTSEPEDLLDDPLTTGAAREGGHKKKRRRSGLAQSSLTGGLPQSTAIRPSASGWKASVPLPENGLQQLVDPLDGGPTAAGPASSSPRSSKSSTDYSSMQCPTGKSQGKWVLNLNCSCNGGKKKLQPPVHASRMGKSGPVVQFTCTHTHCMSFHGGVCPHFQMCPNCMTLRSINSLSNGECRAGKGCRRRNDSGGKKAGETR